MDDLHKVGTSRLLAIALVVAGCGDEAMDDRAAATKPRGNGDRGTHSNQVPQLGFQMHDQLAGRGQRMVIVDFDKKQVILSYGYDGQPTETIRYQESDERIREGREVAADLAALYTALAEDDEFYSDRRNRTCAAYLVYFGYPGDQAGGVLCDDTTYSPLSEAMRDYMQPYREEIPLPPPLP